MGGRPGRGLVGALTGAALAAGALTSSTVAASVATPTLSVTSTVAGQAAPVPLHQTSGWQLDHGIWSLDLRLLAPALADTTVAMTWRSPRFTVRRGSPVFRDDIAVVHQDATGDSHVTVDDMRVCYAPPRSGCWPWFPISTAAPSEFTSAPAFEVYSNGGWDVRWNGKPAEVYVDWRGTIVQRGPDDAHDLVQLAFGTAAKHLRPGNPRTCVAAQTESVCQSLLETTDVLG